MRNSIFGTVIILPLCLATAVGIGYLISHPHTVIKHCKCCCCTDCQCVGECCPNGGVKQPGD